MDEGRLLERLVSVYSPSGREQAAVGRFLGIAARLGYRTRIDAAGNGHAVRGSGSPTVMFLGHIDTVEGRLPVRRSRGRVKGRGAVDAKGALAAALLAGREFPGPGRFEIVAAVGEETDGRGARHLIKNVRPPQALIVGEPSGWDGITIGYRGQLRVEATFRGSRSHDSTPAPTAADAAVDWSVRARSLLVGAGGSSPFRSVSVKIVGLTYEGRSDRQRAVITLDVRLPPGSSTTALLQLLRGLGAGPRLRVPVAVEPVELPRTGAVVTALEAAIRAEGIRPTMWRKGGTSDLNLTCAHWEVPAAAYGPGDSHLDHTAREAVSVEEIRLAARVLGRTVRELASQAKGHGGSPGSLPPPGRPVRGASRGP